MTVAQRNLGVPVDIQVHASAGMPICAQCARVFTRWSVLRAHIQKGRSIALDPLLSSTPRVTSLPVPSSLDPLVPVQPPGPVSASEPEVSNAGQQCGQVRPPGPGIHTYST